MKDYFDYISESSEVDIDDDVLDVYNEMDAELCEFDSYVQEGVGVAIAAGVGGAAIIGGLIALIAKCFGNSSSNSAARAAKEAQKAIDNIEKLPEEGVEVPTPNAIEEVKEEVCDNVKDFIDAAQSILDNRQIPSDDTIKNTANKNSETGIEKEKQAQASTGKKVGTKTVHSKEEAKEAFKKQEQASKEISQMNKALKTKQRELQKATESGKVNLGDKQKKQLEAKRNKAAKAVNAGSNAYRKSANNVLGKLEAGAREIRKFFGI